MGHEGFYNSLLVAMGNIVSALFMYALQAAWLCQRLIDQDYRRYIYFDSGDCKTRKIFTKTWEIAEDEAGGERLFRCDLWHGAALTKQNHGSRPKPLIDGKNITEPVEIVSEWSPNHKRSNPKSRKIETIKSRGESPRRQNETKKRKCGHRARVGTNAFERRLNSSHPYLEGSDAFMTTLEYVNRLGQNLSLRRAFSDINISSGCFDNNQNYLGGENVEETTVSVADQDFFRLIFTEGSVT